MLPSSATKTRRFCKRASLLPPWPTTREVDVHTSIIMPKHTREVTHFRSHVLYNPTKIDKSPCLAGEEQGREVKMSKSVNNFSHCVSFYYLKTIYFSYHCFNMDRSLITSSWAQIGVWQRWRLCFRAANDGCRWGRVMGGVTIYIILFPCFDFQANPFSTPN